ncbi:MAG TPA: HAD-IA family hydrolase [Acinetobacter parvus]|uniref:HAD-IA family hydrolase n=1 Tax=Acinetobacter parvus TaxID=134533 RepID=UPI002C7FABC3|nr:HAD-IA family hydrolase [Acinetobacter parvus]HRM14573.1 HAD-IA family hydrolase [Acinetobacter parvus]
MNKLYSFDLFDTLVTRKIKHPHDIFICIEASGRVHYRSFLFKYIPFSRLRILCEKICRKFEKKEDINIYQIYNLLSFFILNSKEILNLEIELEYKVLYPIEKNVQLINSYIQSGKRVCITSDMYWPKKYILEILSRNNINVDHVYVSSEIGLTKASGNLFKYIANELNFEFENIVHYGDNRVSDYVIPKKLGINSIHIGDAENYKSDNIFNIFKVDPNSNPLFKVGFNFCAPLAYSFSYFIHKNNSNNKNIVFGARDSYLFEKAFNEFFNRNKKSNTFYTRVSRSLVYLPGVHFSKNTNYIFEGSLTTNDFFSRIGLECPERFKNQRLWDIKKEVELYLIKDLNFLNSLEGVSNRVLNYLEKNGFHEDAFFVDIGWRGSVQDSLSLILKSIDIEGYYIGTINADNKKNGFIFQNKKPFKDYFYIFQCISYFEFIFTEPEKSLSGIDFEGENFNYIFTSDENADQISIRENFQKGAYAFFDEFKSLNIDIDEKYLIKSIRNLIKSNTMSIDEEVVSALKKCSHSAGFNGSLQSSLLQFDDFSIMSYLRAPWKAYFMHELKKYSLIKYYIFIILFHNSLFFIFYENFKIIFRKLRALLND